MAKKISHRRFQFLFPATDPDHFNPDHLVTFAGKLRPEQLSGATIFSLQRGSPPEQPEHPALHYLDLDRDLPEDLTDWFSEGYSVIFDPLEPDKQIHPGAFFQLNLKEDSRERIYYSISFKGKTGAVSAGVMLPAEAMLYILHITGKGDLPEPVMVRTILKKLGFREEEVSIHQDAPYDPTELKGAGWLKKLGFAISWNTTLPLTEYRKPFLRELFFSRENPLFRLAFLVTSVAIFILLPILSLDAGLSGDDAKHYEHAIKVYKYYAEGDPSALDDPRLKLNYYGQSFDFFTYLLIRLFHLEGHPYEARHVMVAISGAAAILVTGLLVKLFAGYAGGWLALVLMFLSPRFLGHSFNNPMDVPFALGNIFTLYHIILLLRKLPKISIRSAIWVAVGIGWTNGIRIGGLLLIPYLFMFSGLYLLVHKWPWPFFSAGWWKFALRGLMTLVLISVAGYLISVVTWPYALQDIINHPIQAFKVMTNIQVSIRVLYNGMIHWSDRLPWHYIPLNILITVPVLILLGWLASAFTWYLDRREKMGFWYFMLWFTVLFPVIFIIIRESNVYGGWRHMMFIYPSMLALAAMALTRLIRIPKKSWVRGMLIVLVAAGMIHPLRHTIRNHPNTYIYFNEWSGGINHNYGRFETDYYANSLRPASDYFLEEILPEIPPDTATPLKVVSNFDISYYFRNNRDRVTPLYSRYYDRGNMDWDYAILYCNYIHPYQLNNGMWPPKNTIHRVMVDDVVVAAVVERRNRDDYLGAGLLSEAVSEQDPEKLNRAVELLESALAYDQTNEAAYLELGNAYTALLHFQDARTTMDQLLEIYPDYDKALNLRGYTYLIESQVNGNSALLDEAIRNINLAIASNHKFYSGYYNLGICYGLKDDKDNAVYNFRQAIRYNGRFRDAYEKLAEVYEYYGEPDMARSVREQLSRIQ